MALIKCPECGTDVSDLAEQCPHCAYPIKAKHEVKEPVVVAKEGCFLQTLNTGCMIIVGIIGSVILFAILSKACNP